VEARRSRSNSDADLASLIRTAGLRVTATRLGVLRALRERPHADAESVIEHVRAQLGSASSQTVYSVLAAFVDAGIVRRIEPAGSPALHELRVGDNHHHVVCRRCGATADIDCAVGERPCLTPSETRGYLLDEAEVTFWGVCPTCQQALEPHTSSSTAMP
jgi:Fe2+ or Zn2+ uptake regulation protein